MEFGYNTQVLAVAEKLSASLAGPGKMLICVREEWDKRFWEQVCKQLGLIPVFVWAGILWKDLLKLAFTSRAFCAVGSAEILLGLSKLAVQTRTPLSLRYVIAEGTEPKWMTDRIQESLDCVILQLEESVSLGQVSGNAERNELLENLLSWNSVLDFRVTRTEYGLCLETVVFPGKNLPHLPSCARLLVRNWNGEKDSPFVWKVSDF